MENDIPYISVDESKVDQIDEFISFFIKRSGGPTSFNIVVKRCRSVDDDEEDENERKKIRFD